MRATRFTAGLMIALLGLSACMHTVKGGEAAFERGDYDLAAKRWRLEALHGNNGAANYNIGLIHENGLGSAPKNPAYASQWYLRAAQLGYVPGMLAIARLQMASSQEAAALSWYQAAAQHGSTEAVQILSARGVPLQAPAVAVAEQQPGLDPQAAQGLGLIIGCAIAGGCRQPGLAPRTPVQGNMRCTPTKFGDNAPTYNCRPQ